MGGRAGGGGLSRAKKGLGDARDQIDALGRERRGELLAGRVELRQERALLDLSVARAGAVGEHVGHGICPRSVAHAAITSLQPLSSVFGARPTTRMALPKRPPAPASIVATTPMSSVSTLWPG